MTAYPTPPTTSEGGISTLSTHGMLRTNLSVLPHVGALNLVERQGLARSIQVRDVASGQQDHAADQHYFQEFMSDKPTPDVIVEPVISRVTKVWTTDLTRKITAAWARSSALPFAASDRPTSRVPFASLALDGDTAI